MCLTDTKEEKDVFDLYSCRFLIQGLRLKINSIAQSVALYDSILFENAPEMEKKSSVF